MKEFQKYGNFKDMKSKTAWNNDQYARDRKLAYPKIEDQLDKIFHEGIDAWKSRYTSNKRCKPQTILKIIFDNTPLE